MVLRTQALHSLHSDGISKSSITDLWMGLEGLGGFVRCFPRIDSSLGGREEA